jgi:ABC-type antimicrobial peptide transport system permease subunit
MALGATRTDIMRLVLGRGLVLVAGGLGLGFGGALAVSRLLSNFLFNVSSIDPITFAGVPLLLGGMALVASYIPAFRATRIDPAVALRSE